MSTKRGRPRKKPAERMNHEVRARVPADVLDWYQEAAEKAGYDDLAKWVRAVLNEAAQRIAPRG